MERVTIIGGGLAGCEAAWRLARHGVEADLYEMKPSRFSEAHSSSNLAELVCSNSLRSNDANSAVGLLKEEMRQLNSVVMQAAEETKVPAGKALAVDRNRFAGYITGKIESLPGIRVIREEVEKIDPARLAIVAAGPLASEALSTSLAELVGADHLYFYDAIAPIVMADSIDYEKAFIQSRYGPVGEGDYINCPMTKEEYQRFYTALMEADKTPLRDFEKPRFFEGCLPIEVMAERGIQTLTFGPMKPVGLTDPHTGKQPYAVLQLRRENQAGTLYNMVGFQTRLNRPSQDRVFRLIPGLEAAEFARWGSVHRNTFINGPSHLNRFLQIKDHPNVFMAGQIAGVEGYVESAAMGILAGENAARLITGRPMTSPPITTAMGGMINHLTDTTSSKFQPSNINFGLLPPLPQKMKKRERGEHYSRRAMENLEQWCKENEI
jgi:methylenetetrahydrofolate--tRNA-(uracil-5-)-methyltransferase